MMWLVNRLVGAVVGLTLAAAGIVVVVEAVRFLTGGAPVLIPVEDWAAGLERARWADTTTVLVLVVVGLVGLLFVIAELAPRRPVALGLAGSDGDHAASVDRQGLESRIRRAVETDADVARCRVRVGRRRAEARVVTPWDVDGGQVRERATQAMTAALETIGLDRDLRTRVRVDRERERVA
ncbi:MAG: hypothetical protein H0V93_02545 [Euzebyales bacterium]|jgi:hypothetical protein|nr:hypothetical protein [Euzebyales bacterium]